MRARNTLKVQRVVSLILEMNPSELVALRQKLGADFDLPPDAGAREPSRPPDREYSALAEKMEEQAFDELGR